jgi:hypothetical protein
MTDLEKVEARYGKRLRVPIGHGEPLLEHHARGNLDDGRKFIYCPIGALLSWSEGDYDHSYCPWCHEYFEALVS